MWEPAGKVDVEGVLEVLEIDNIRPGNGGEIDFCVSPTSRILTDDLRWVEAQTLVEGQGLWAFDEHPVESDVQGPSRSRRWRQASVVATRKKKLKSSKVVLSNGKEMTVSDDHMWLVRKYKTGSSEWIKTKDLSTSHYLLKILDVWDEFDTRDAGWLAGIFDGEGTMAVRKGRLALAASQNPGSVLEKLKTSLDSFGFDWKQYAAGHNPQYPESTCQTVRLQGGIANSFRFLGSIRPERIIGSFDPSKMDGQAALRAIETPQVVEVVPLGAQTVIAFSTTTKTFFCEGYASHNSCPYPAHENGDASASARINSESCMFFCHGCKRKGSIIRLVSSLMDISPIKARRMLREAYDPRSLNPDQRKISDEVAAIFAGKKIKKEPENVPIDESFAEAFSIEWELVEESENPPASLRYMLDRGFTAETLNFWGIGYDDRGHRITIPVRDEFGKLLGFKGRAWKKIHKPKYLVLGDKDPEDEENSRFGFGRYLVSKILFGMDKVILSGKIDEIIVVEGELNVIALWQMGYENAVALNGSTLSKRQEKLIKRAADKVIFFLDADAAGDRALWGYTDEEGESHPGVLERLSRAMEVGVVSSDRDAADWLSEGPEGTKRVRSLLRYPSMYLKASIARRKRVR